jgi:acyl carrier protein
VTEQTILAAPTMTATERAIAEMWRDLLGVSEIDTTDDFFDLGGTSLTAIKLLQRVEGVFGSDALTPDALYADGRLASVAKAVDEATGQ